jgi:hypothetical protein
VSDGRKRVVLARQDNDFAQVVLVTGHHAGEKLEPLHVFDQHPHHDECWRSLGDAVEGSLGRRFELEADARSPGAPNRAHGEPLVVREHAQHAVRIN